MVRSALLSLLFFMILSSLQGLNAKTIINNQVSTFIDLEKKFQEPSKELFSSLKKTETSLVQIPHSLSHQWISFPISNNTQEEVYKVIWLDFALTGKLTLFKYEDDRFYKLGIGGSFYKPKERQLPSHLTAFKVKIPPNKKIIILLKRETNLMLDTNVIIETSEEFSIEDKRDSMWITFYFGAICSLILYNLFLFISTKNFIHLLYVCFSTSMSAVLLLICNGYELLFMNFINFDITFHLPKFGIFMVLFAFIFCKEFIGKDYLPKFGPKAIKSLLCFCFAILILDIFIKEPFFKKIIYYLADSLAILMLVGVLYFSICAYKKKHELATFYLIAWSALIMSGVSWFLRYFGINTPQLPPKFIMLLGNFLEMTIIALSFTYKASYLDKIRAEMNAVKNEKENYQTLLRSLTHDLGNHISNLYNYSLALYDHSLASKTTQNFKNRVDHSFDNIVALMQNAKSGDRALSNPSGENTPFSLSPVSICEVFDDAILIHHQKILDKNLRVNVNCPKQENYVMAEKYSLLNNVISNIFSNSIKFSPIGGKINLSCMKKDKEVVVTIRDFGLGIPNEVLKTLAENKSCTPEKGTMGELGEGNGLIITKSFLELFNGKLILEKQEVGTLATLIFPI